MMHLKYGLYIQQQHHQHQQSNELPNLSRIILSLRVIHQVLLMTIQARVVHQIIVLQASEVVIHHQAKTLRAARPVLNLSLDRVPNPLLISFHSISYGVDNIFS